MKIFVSHTANKPTIKLPINSTNHRRNTTYIFIMKYFQKSLRRTHFTLARKKPPTHRSIANKTLVELLLTGLDKTSEDCALPWAGAGLGAGVGHHIESALNMHWTKASCCGKTFTDGSHGGHLIRWWWVWSRFDGLSFFRVIYLMFENCSR